MQSSTDPVQLAWGVLKENPNRLPDFWATVYRNALEAAFRQQDVQSGVGLAIFAAISLESQGRPTVALTHLEDALAIFGGDLTARARLIARRSLVEALSSDDVSLQTLARARRGIRSLDTETVLDIDIYTAVIRAIMLQPDCVERGERITASNPPPPPGMVAGTKPWIVAAMHAFGMAERSEIWITSLGAYSEAARDVFRRADVAALDYSTQARSSLIEPDEDGLAAAPRNTIARWRVEVTRLYLNLLRRDREAAKASIAALQSLGERMNPIWRAGIPCYEAAREAWFEDGTEAVFPSPPESVSAITLPAGLAGLNASSQAGSQDEAVLWRRWADASLPAHIQSSLSPISRSRSTG